MRKVSSISIRSPHERSGIPLSTNCKFKIIIRTTKPELTVGFVLVDMPGFAMCAGKTDEMYAEKISSDPKFWERCSFHPSVNLWYDSFCAFECTRKAGRYITFRNGIFKCRKYDGTPEFKQEASFVFNTNKLLKKQRQRAHSSIVPPNKEELISTTTATRKLSLDTFQNGHENEQQRFRSNQLSLRMNRPNEKALYSVNYDSCAGCLNLKLYRKDTLSATVDTIFQTTHSIVDLNFPSRCNIEETPEAYKCRCQSNG